MTFETETTLKRPLPAPISLDETGAKSRPRVLVVDDEPLILWSVRSGLSDRFDVEVASSAEAALDLLRARPFDALLTDLLMDGMDGFDMAEEARRIRPGIRMFMMSAYGSRESFRSAEQCGFRECIEKPFPIRKVREMLLRHLEPHGNQE